MKKISYLSFDYLLIGTLIIFSVLTRQISCEKQNNFNSLHHKTKEAESKVNDLYCYKCDMMQDEDCLNINKTESNERLRTKCSQNETMCSVKRFSYTIADKNSTSEKKLWSLQRNCTSTCTNSCIIIGERTKIHACETCCEGNLCNVGSDGEKTNFNAYVNFATSIIVISSTYFFS
ncbi:hypothetical protein PVAND_008691 [Polypedilum vanderplanki]|uniref:Uncharacterized protein n=1 Tax=Polypedilum vanderplanki TaxID=319348 RepID=A0A9J6CAK6_POLVA|nr:hypothetical protein PVAND_008691 [Polypedilum vanderplanki]